MPLKEISKKTWTEVKAEERQRRLAYARELLKDYPSKSLRTIANEREMSHEQVRILILEVLTEEAPK